MHEAPASHPLQGCRLLLVEDNALIADVIAGVLEDAGARLVGPYASMVEALENLDVLTAIDGAILDIGLGKEESYPLAEALQTTRIPFMFLTGLDRSQLPGAFAHAPHMQKPFSDIKLIAKLVAIGVTRN